MIYGEIVTNQSYYDVYAPLLSLIKENFSEVESGVQGDAYIWIKSGDEKVALDTFTSMRFQIKSNKVSGLLVEQVITTLESEYKLYIYNEPEREGHEDIL
jgi:hypothetical protein